MSIRAQGKQELHSNTEVKQSWIVCWLPFLTHVRNSMFVSVVFKVESMQRRGVVRLCEVMRVICAKSLMCFHCRSGSGGQILRSCVFTHQTDTHRERVESKEVCVRERGSQRNLNALINLLNANSKCFLKQGNNESRRRKQRDRKTYIPLCPVQF